MKALMAKAWKEWLNGGFDEVAYRENADQIADSNLRFYKLFDYIMIALLVALYASTFFSSYAQSLVPVYWLFILLSVIELVVLSKARSTVMRWAKAVVYYGLVKAYVFCLLTSVVFNVDGPAITFYVFLILLPVSFMLHPIAMYVVQTVATVAFCVTTLLCKPIELAVSDVFSCLLFFVISLAIAGQISKLRIANISMAAAEHKNSVEMENQRDLLGLALKVAKLGVWSYDVAKKQTTSTYAPPTMVEFEGAHDNMPESIIEAGFVHPDSADTLRDLYARAQRGEGSIQGDVQLRSDISAPFGWMHIVMIPSKEADGSVRRYLGTMEDVTERKNTELQYIEQLRVLDSANDLNLITKGRWNLTTNTQEVQEGQDGASLPIDQVSTYEGAMAILTETVFPEDKKIEMRRTLERQRLIDAYLQGTDSYTFEYQRMTSDNMSLWVRMLVRVCRVPGSEDITAFGFSYDITDEVLNRSIVNRLVSVEYDFLGTIDVSTKCSVVQSAQDDFKETLRNMGVYKTAMDYDSSFLTAIGRVALPEERDLLLQSCNLAAIIEALAHSDFVQVPFSIQESGKVRRKSLGYCYLGDEKDTILYFRTDITDMYSREQEQLRQTEKALKAARRASSAKTDFFSRMSHDMRTPMNGILGLAALSEGDDDPAVLKRNIVKIRESGEYLLGLINDTLDFQRIESGRLVLEPQIVSARELVENVTSIIEVTAASKGVRFFTTCVGAELDCFIKVDPMRMKQVLLNLISNAIKFTPAGGEVELGLECGGRDGALSHCIVTVRDTGIGMSEKFLKNGIFKPFSQERSDVIESYAGSGLGLSIVKNLVEHMGGTVEVESEQGRGTTFTIRIDIEHASEDEVAEATSAQRQRRRGVLDTLEGTQILLAEDHPLNAEVARRLLTKVGCEIQWVKNGRACVDEFLGATPATYDLILMDVRMPEMDGLEATRRIRSSERPDAQNIPIIAITANAYDEDVRQAFAAGVSAHVAKPIDALLLYETIANCLQSLPGDKANAASAVSAQDIVDEKSLS